MKECDLSSGIKLYSEQKIQDALTFFLSTPEPETPEDAAERAYYLGLCYTKMGLYEQALEFLEQVITASSDDGQVFQCRLLLSLAYAKTGRISLAEDELRILEQKSDTHSEKTELYNALGFVAFERGDAATAIEYYEKVLSISPENTTALNGLGYVLAETGEMLSRALVLCRQASDAKPDYGPYLDSLAWVYYKMHFTQEAQRVIKKALELMPDSEIVQKHYDEIMHDE